MEDFNENKELAKARKVEKKICDDRKKRRRIKIRQTTGANLHQINCKSFPEMRLNR